MDIAQTIAKLNAVTKPLIQTPEFTTWTHANANFVAPELKFQDWQKLSQDLTNPQGADQTIVASKTGREILKGKQAGKVNLIIAAADINFAALNAQAAENGFSFGKKAVTPEDLVLLKDIDFKPLGEQVASKWMFGNVGTEVAPKMAGVMFLKFPQEVWATTPVTARRVTSISRPSLTPTFDEAGNSLDLSIKVTGLRLALEETGTEGVTLNVRSPDSKPDDKHYRDPLFSKFHAMNAYRVEVSEIDPAKFGTAKDGLNKLIEDRAKVIKKLTEIRREVFSKRDDRGPGSTKRLR